MEQGEYRKRKKWPEKVSKTEKERGMGNSREKDRERGSVTAERKREGAGIIREKAD